MEGQGALAQAGRSNSNVRPREGLPINFRLAFQGHQKDSFIRPDLQLQLAISLEAVVGIEPDVAVDWELDPGSHQFLGSDPWSGLVVGGVLMGQHGEGGCLWNGVGLVDQNEGPGRPVGIVPS
jgi:hypothetical protein